MLGHPVMLTSPQQLCSVLYEELKLPPPARSVLRVCSNSFRVAREPARFAD
jgi:DNA polymerase I-like protein with 3'-5' exonuclease and polymerase domains